MEKVQNLKHCSWISDEISIKCFHDQHNEVLQSTFKSHPSKVGWQEACSEFFSKNVTENLEEEAASLEGGTKQAIEQLYNLEQMEEDCSIDLLTVPNELPSCDRLDDGTTMDSHLPTNWFEGSVNDSVIPEGGADRLLTLYHQTAELNKRTRVGDYSTLRFRTLKYFTTVRLPQDINTAPLETSFPEDVIINVRVQRPYFKKTHYKKSSNKFSAHAQELLLLGSQHLTALRDVIECVNDFAVHRNLINEPDLEELYECTRAKEEFPSGMFYINGTLYSDMRHQQSKDYSVNLLKWAHKMPEFGEIKTASMDTTRFCDITLRLGYPYLYLHQGYCEHLITFTDVRLRERIDPSDPSLYPIARGHATKLSTRCCTCNRNLATWILVNCSLMSLPNALVCDACLKQFCYDDAGAPVESFELFPYYDEGTMQVEKLRRLRMAVADGVEKRGGRGGRGKSGGRRKSLGRGKSERSVVKVECDEEAVDEKLDTEDFADNAMCMAKKKQKKEV